jgi:hypothetical protein
MTRILTRTGYIGFPERPARRAGAKHAFPEPMEVLSLGLTQSGKPEN